MGFINNLKKSYYDKVDRMTRKKESIERTVHLLSINYNADSQIQKMMEDVLKANYLDIFVYEDCIKAAHSTFYFKDYGKENLRKDEIKKFALHIKGGVSKLRSKYVYCLRPIYDFTGGGAINGHYGLNQRGNVEWFSGDSSGEIVGWRVHNENYDVSAGIFKEWSVELHRYRRWDVKNRRYLD